ncbi:MAG: hypothetical protein KGZ86_07985 [Candidatus Latescibacteria bacterium]|nr:hypothetical protein [Candidatus Latescibacterota bacterium]
MLLANLSFKQINYRRIIILVTLIIGILAVWSIQFNLDLSRKTTIREQLMEELSYFPSGKFLKPAVIEYQTAVADIIYLRAIQYYAHHLLSDRKYIWLNHIFNILNALDPHFIGAFDFGSIILAWDAEQIDEAMKLLYSAIANNPTNWKLVFNAAFIEYMLTKDYVSAGYYFEIASKLPETWAITNRWAAFAFARGGATQLAVEVWYSIYETTENRKLKEIAERELQRLGFKVP